MFADYKHKQARKKCIYIFFPVIYLLFVVVSIAFSAKKKTPQRYKNTHVISDVCVCLLFTLFLDKKFALYRYLSQFIWLQAIVCVCVCVTFTNM